MHYGGVSCCGTAPVEAPDEGLSLRVQGALTALCGLFLLIAVVGAWLPVPLLQSPYWAYASVGFGSVFALREAFEALREKSLGVNFLMVLAAAGAVAVGAPKDAAALLFLFSLASSLESLAMGKTRSAIEGLIKLRPDTATRLLPDGREEEVRVEALAPGDLVSVSPYQQVPCDGELLSARAEIDESAMTGESRPAEKLEGDVVLAGTQNLDSALKVRVTKAVGDTTLDKIVNLVAEARDQKASGERISTWFGERYTFFVLAVFGISLAVRMVSGQGFGDALYPSLILLVALSPCALVISTPVSTLSALTWAARHGLLVRGGKYIEAAGRIDTLAIDKTGTLTTGVPKLDEICVGGQVPALVGARSLCITCQHKADDCDCIVCWRPGDSLPQASAQALRFAASAEAESTHPIAEAITRAARDLGLDVPRAEAHRARAGLGVVAEVEGTEVKLGRATLFDPIEEPLPGAFADHVNEMRSRGLTAVLMRYGNQWAALGLRDTVRTDAAPALDSLRKLGIDRIVMLTGDDPVTAQAVAKELGIDEVAAGLMPDGKAELIDRLGREGRRVMMVGDGVNDAPALAKAELGAAMGGLGSDIALNAADTVIVHDKLERLPQFVRLGRRAQGVIRANLMFAAGIILALTVGSVFFSIPLPLAVIGHEGSTLLVILNGLRLLAGPGKG